MNWVSGLLGVNLQFMAGYTPLGLCDISDDDWQGDSVSCKMTVSAINIPVGSINNSQCASLLW